MRKAAVLIEALPYIQRFRGETILIKFGGSVMTDDEVFVSALRDIVFLECVGAKPVIIHGGGKEITARLTELNIPTRFINGLRYTCPDTIRVVDDVLHTQTNPRLVQAINDLGGKARGLSGKRVRTATKLQGGEDLGFVGEVTAVAVAPIAAVLAAGEVPVVTPLAAGADGQAYNINADIAACRVAEALQPAKLVFLSDVPGILRDRQDEASLIPTIRVEEVNGLIRDGVISGGMVPKVHSAVAALQAGCRQVHMIDARLQHSLLLEIFTDRGVGTEIVH
jgi:acetylglutamate kinase